MIRKKYVTCSGDETNAGFWAWLETFIDVVKVDADYSVQNFPMNHDEALNVYAAVKRALYDNKQKA